MDATPVEHAFDTPEPVELYVENGSGTIDLTATDTARTEIRISGRHAADVTVTRDGDRISVVPPRLRSGFFGGDHKLDMTLVVPSRSRLVVKSGSADVIATGTLAATRIKSGSGDVRLDRLDEVGVIDTGSGDVVIAEAEGELRIRSGSGDAVLDQLHASLSISTGSGDIRIARAGGPVVVKTGSGDLEIGDSDDDVAMTTGSGDVVIRTAHRGRISSRAASGDVTVGIPSGTPVWTDITTVTGSVSSRIPSVGQPEPGAPHVELRATTVSGDVALLPA
jgi:DUF4097 and DUF4098 domain-containing protein YvlB